MISSSHVRKNQNYSSLIPLLIVCYHIFSNFDFSNNNSTKNQNDSITLERESDNTKNTNEEE